MCLPRSLVVVGIVVVAAGLTHAAAPPGRLVDRYGDPLPPGAVARLGTVRWRNMLYRMSTFAFLPGGKQLATTNAKGTLTLWDLGTGRMARTICDEVSPDAH